MRTPCNLEPAGGGIDPDHRAGLDSGQRWNASGFRRLADGAGADRSCGSQHGCNRAVSSLQNDTVSGPVCPPWLEPEEGARIRVEPASWIRSIQKAQRSRWLPNPLPGIASAPGTAT